MSRQRLVEQLCEFPDRKLTLISAPAGFGKTTLLSEWVDHLPSDYAGTVGWYALDESDNDPTRFLTYLITVLTQIDGIDDSIGEGLLTALQSPQSPPIEGTLIPLINSVAEHSTQIILILDDYHVIVNAQIDDVMTYLLEHLPPPVHLVIATRDDPQLPLARVRARGQLTELRAADLRFTADEAAAFLNQAMGLNLSLEDIRHLDHRTEGWIAGLQLAAISMQGHDDPSSMIRSFSGSHRFVLDYLIEEVLEQQTAGIQTFLLQTAILDRMCGSLCDAVTGQESGQETLEKLDHANLFIVPLDEVRTWYRYHHLFADLLRKQLHSHQSTFIADLHIKAAAWFKAQGLTVDAIRHSLMAHDYHRAAHLMEEIALATVEQGKHTTVIEWINALPEEIVIEHPYLCVVHAKGLQLTGQLEAAESRLIDAEIGLKAAPNQDDERVRTVRGLVQSLRAYLNFMTGNHAKTISYAEQALAQLPESNVLIRVQTALYLGVAHRHLGHSQAALDVFSGLMSTIDGIGGNSVAILCFANLGALYIDQARLHQARELFDKALTFIAHHTGRSDLPYAGYIYVNIGQILRQWNQLDEAYHYAAKGVALCRKWNVHEILGLSYIELAYIYQALGNEEEADTSIQEALQIVGGFSSWGTNYVAAHQVKMQHISGDVAAINRWAMASDLNVDSDFEFHREIEFLALIRHFLAQQRLADAQSLAERILHIAQASGKRQTMLELHILLALICAAHDNIDQALPHLEQALVTAEPENYMRIFLDEGPPMAQLLYAALARDIMPNYVRQLLAAFPVFDKPVHSKPQSAQYDWIEPLSARELDVLLLMAEGLPNPDIAQRLYISVNTVKVHTRNIFDKLDVHNRTQAVARARSLGMLPAL